MEGISVGLVTVIEIVVMIHALEGTPIHHKAEIGPGVDLLRNAMTAVLPPENQDLTLKPSIKIKIDVSLAISTDTSLANVPRNNRILYAQCMIEGPNLQTLWGGLSFDMPSDLEPEHDRFLN